ncbi:MAG TPA: gliding motility-associated ABC transporter ATP-binding subunit GldA [Bacteroidales bacterium]|nr:gliding motility-associated ABC transporter ATP-binding subunit GldA [Bacteroidales bacterium]MDD4234394.1 gliding motility-associated ABC transporter ATP-binding subunit GldA [Bacteroidales bacterium]HRW20339.1 gliding motility-associated ABC transporter ATP-binding subunit GldA [Bacteroidales bacterium]HXK80736.1 gliding motility-associated ABC transporter ATP-binding subunit GldA [Bacteroidales bacterium]
MSIEVKNITKIYGKQKALDSVSFRIEAGEIVGFLGPNGAGKSTLMKIITGFLPQTSGEAFVNDINVFEQSLKVRKLIGYLPETNPLYSEMYVREYLEFVAGIFKIKKRRARINNIVEQTGLGPELHKKISALSKGYKQRVGLAQAIIHDPEVLILDEPTSGLDPNQIIEIRSLIAELGKKKTVILSTHILQEVQAICQRVLIINKGILVADNSTDNIAAARDKNNISIIVEFENDVSKNELMQISGVERAALLKNNCFIIEGNKNNDLRPNLMQFAVNNKRNILSLTEKSKNLEEVFQELTK